MSSYLRFRELKGDPMSDLIAAIPERLIGTWRLCQMSFPRLRLIN